MRLSHARGWLALPLILVSVGGWAGPGSRRLFAQATPPAENDEESARQRQIVERFLTVLERNPRRGTALDRIYGYHIENGTIEAFVKGLRDRVASQSDDGAGWMILGLVESQRGRDAAAVEALTKAKELRKTDPLAAYYLGQSLVLVGQPDKAILAFEEAIERKPGQVDLLEIFQALGRVHQRAQRTQEALTVWNRLEGFFPNDPRVQEQIAVTLVEEGQAAEALPRYEALTKSTSDDYRRTVYQMEAAELKIKLNRASEGTADLERLLSKLNPENWLFREVRRKIEEVFLRTDDQDGLAKYYTAWLAKNPEDIEAMARLARVLARQARVPEARDWLDKALKLAPSRKELRLAFIEQLVDDQRYPEAIEQYAALDKADPNNPDYLRDWGKLILRDTSRPKAERQTEAEKVWRQLLAARASDALIATQVADLFRHAELEAQALELYQKAVELAPGQPQYREYLGEYLHILKRPEEAIAAWRKMTEGNQRTATNVARLAEVFAQFGYVEQALPEIAAACELDPKDFSLQLKAAELQLRGEAFAAALDSLARADKLAQNDEEHEAVLTQQIKTFTLQDKLADMARQLTEETSRGAAAHQQWFLLARYCEALHEFPEASKAIQEALKLQPDDIRSLAAAGRIAEQSGDLKQSADLNRKLAVVDRRGRTEYLQHVARLETQLGRIDEALAAGRDLIAASPGNVETYQFFADMCFRLNRADDGLTALRRATRVNPNEPALLLSLAAALAGQFRTDEAIELYWQTLEKQSQLDDKLNVIGKLAELYMQTNHLDQLLERLQRGQREADKNREMTICLAQAYQSAGDYGMARQELERLLGENTRDTQLLLQLSKLAEGEGDLTSAVKYQEHLAKLAPGPEAEFRLATLLARAGDNQASAEILVRLAVKEDDKEKLLRNIDGLMAAEQYDTAIAVLEPKLRENAADWELLYREGFALAKRRPAEAPRRFQAILDLSASDDEPGIVAKNRQAKQKTQPVTFITSTAVPATSVFGATAAVVRRPIRTDYAYEIRRAIGLDPEPYYGPTMTRRPMWTPQDFGQARLAAVGWLFSFAQKENKAEAFVAERKVRAEATTAGPRELWDWVNLQAIRADEDALLPATRRLAEKGGPSEKLLYLMKLAARGGDVNINNPRATPENDDKTPPLDADELAFVLRIYDDVRKLPADPQGMNWYYTRAAAASVLKELSRAGRKEDEQRLFHEIINRATTVEELSSALQLVLQRRDSAMFLDLFDRLAAKDLQKVESRGSGVTQVSQSVSQALGQFIGQVDLSITDVQSVLARFLAYHAAKTNQRRSSPTYRPPTRSLTARQNNYVYVWAGNSQRYTQLPYPAPGEYFDQSALGVLRGVFEVFRGKDLASDLVKHLESHQGQMSPGEKLYAALALAYVQVWNEDREAGAATLAQAAALAPQDLDLRLEGARLHLEMGQFDEALAIVDSVSALDQRTLQQREALALDLAVRLGDHQRARDAAQRLFGLRLDAETQVSLAGQMRRLGMNEESDAVLARAQRQAGSRISALSALMGQYQAQAQMEVAAQVAHQILRRSRTAPAAQTAMGYSTADSQARRSALQCLAQAGKLKELIAGLEQQIERTPQASQLYETLLEYYQAAGDTQKLIDLQAKIVSLRPDDADLRYRYGQELYRRGKFNEACDEYVAVIKKQPQLLRNRYYEVQQAFQRARREADLVRVLGEMDLKSFGQPYIVTNMLSNMMRDQQSRATAMVLFKKAWEAFPEQRSNMMSSFYDPAVWKSPEVLEYGKQSLLPTAGTLRNNPWYGIYSALSFDGEGRINAVLHRVLDAAASTNQLGKLRGEIAAAIAEYPRWLAGPVMLAVVDLRMGNQIDLPATMQSLIDATSNDPYQLRYARWIVAQELEAKAATKELALKLYERAAVSDERDLNDEFQYGPSRRLVHLYKDAGRTEDARKLLLDAAYRRPIQDGNFAYRLSQKAESLIAIGGMLQEMNQPVDSLRVYRELLLNPDFGDPQISMYSGRSADQFRTQARRGVDLAVKKLAEKPSAEHLQAFLTPAGKQTKGGAAIDLMIAATPAGASPLPSLDSPLVGVIRPTGLSSEATSQIQSQLTELATKHPDDLSVQIAQTLFALKGKDAAKADAALQRLTQLADANPLEAVSAGKRANARQRAEAAPQIGLWLVARECLNDRARREVAESLAARAIAAAQRQLDTAELTAIMYERGKLALDAGDRAAAEKYWNQLIDLALVEPRKPRPATASPQNPVTGGVPSAGVVVAPRPAGAPLRPATSPGALPRTGKIPATLSQFKLGASIAQAAAENNLVALSLRAIRETLSGGVPVADLPRASDPFATATIRPAPMPGASSRSDIDETVFTELSKRMWQLSLAWKKHSFPPDDACRLLEEIVFPAARPGDVLIYEQSVANDLSNPQSIGRLLVEWSVRAGRTVELEKQVAARHASPTDIVGGQVLLVQLAVAQRQPGKAHEHMQAILKQLETSKLSALSGLALHAAAAAFGDQQLVASAAPLLEKIISTPAPLGRSISFGPPGPFSPATTLVRHHLRTGGAAAVQAQIDRFLQSRQELYARFSGESSAYQQKLDLIWAANELARGGDLAKMLPALGRSLDVTVTRDYYNPQTVNTNVALWHLARQARKLPAAERYAVLRDWTLPAESRRGVRVVAGFDSGQSIPECFLSGSGLPVEPLEPTAPATPLSNLTLLVEAAAEAGKLDELSQAAEPLANDKIPGGEALALLVLLARRDVAAAGPRLEAIAKRVKESTRTQSEQNRAGEPRAKLEWDDYLVAHAALAVPELSVQATRLCELLMALGRSMNQTDVLYHLAYDIAQTALAPLSQPERRELTSVPLAHWTEGGSAAQAHDALPPALWAVCEGHLVRRGASGAGTLVLNRPLTGEFEFSFDGYSSPESRSGLGYGGIAHAPSYAGGPVTISSASLGVQVNRPPAVENRVGWNRARVRVSPTSVRFYFNDRLTYEDRSPSRTSPWLVLNAFGTWSTMKNLRLTGTPTIPREVPLVDADRLDGWNASFYREQMPNRLKKAEPESESAALDQPQYVMNPFGEYVQVDPNASVIYDWQAEDGVLSGRVDQTASPTAQSRLFYHRPLADGERVTYQFLYEPGRTQVHPTLGGIAFLLEPAGVKLHWMTQINDAADPQLVDSRNAIDEPAIRRGPPQLPFKDDDWNDVEVAIRGNVLSITLNGRPVCERPIEPTNDHRFGFFHFKADTAVKVRNVVLQGNWADSLTAAEQNDLLAAAIGSSSPALDRAQHAVVGERALTTAAYDVWKQSQDMAPADRYTYLKSWVLPNDSHPSLRLQVDWTPTDPIASSAPGPRGAASSPSQTPAMLHDGGDLVSPALELLAVAKELKKLDELATAAALAAKEYPDQARPLVSFGVLLALARGDNQAVAAGLQKATEFVKTQPAETPLHERHPEFLATYAALASPNARNLAKTLAQEIVKDQQQPRNIGPEWARRTPHLRALANWAADKTTANIPFGQTPPMTQWRPVTRSTASERGEGYPAGPWKLAAGEATYLTGSPRAALYHAVPLTGDFEVRGQITTAANRTIRLIYGGVAFAVSADAKQVIRQEVGRSTDIRTPLAEKPKDFGPNVEYKLIVKDSVMTAFVNGQQVHTEPLPAAVDPWLAIETTTANQTGMIKNVQITGAPTVPGEINLSAALALEGWRADYYGERAATVDRNSGQASEWSKKGEEIVATRLSNAAGSFRESVLQYHRPLLEDGEVEYDFYYEPGKTEVHPALDRLAFLLAPDGVKTHWLTDAQHERTGLAPDNSEPAAGSRPAPLKAGDWNKLKLTLRGDEAILFVNGTEVARRKIDPTNQRTFGLFRFADASGVRVRNVVHRGNWPRALPPLVEQELAVASK
jgi:tetratricopeptide (TPR) repeat protein